MDYTAFNNDKRTSLILKIRTRKRLQARGKKGETYDQIINKLLDLTEKKKK